VGNDGSRGHVQASDEPLRPVETRRAGMMYVYCSTRGLLFLSSQECQPTRERERDTGCNFFKGAADKRLPRRPCSQKTKYPRLVGMDTQTLVAKALTYGGWALPVRRSPLRVQFGRKTCAQLGCKNMAAFFSVLVGDGQSGMIDSST
jgi:hypothetical protein